jgi:DNA ligase-associated metallophosphoesterase
LIDTTIELRGERLRLMPERAAFWERESMLLVADPHWGKAATFRAGGIPVPSGTTREAIARLDSAVTRTNAKTIAFLGDLLHAPEGRSDSLFSALHMWRESRRNLHVILVRGNHDRRAGDPPASLGFDCVDAPHVVGPFALAHHPASHDTAYVLAGHVHPGVWVPYAGRVSCFVFGDSCGILPAFGDFTGLALVDREAGERVFAIGDSEVLELTAS